MEEQGQRPGIPEVKERDQRAPGVKARGQRPGTPEVKEQGQRTPGAEAPKATVL